MAQRIVTSFKMASGTSSDERNLQQLEQEVHGMISKLTDKLAALGKSKASPNTSQESEEADNGVRIITLAGGNKGATMRAAGLDELVDAQGIVHGDDENLSAYTNSNYQAVNNSIMLGGSCAAEDPGVHIVISEDYVVQEYAEEKDMHAKKDKLKKATSSKEEHPHEELF